MAEVEPDGDRQDDAHSSSAASVSGTERSLGEAVVEDLERDNSTRAQKAPAAKKVEEPTMTSISPDDNDESEVEFIDRSLFLFAPEHPIRAFCIKVSTNKWFNWFILLVIIVNAAFLAANDPLKGKKEGFNVVNFYADYIFLVIFVVEAVLKIIALGFVLHKYSYLRSTSGRLRAPNVIQMVGTGSMRSSS